MVAAGMPSETWGMSRTRRFLPVDRDRVGTDRATMAASPERRPQRRPGKTIERGVALDADQLPSGRWRTRVRHPRTHRQLSARTSDRRPRDLRDPARRAGRRERGAQASARRRPSRRHRRRVLGGVDDRPAVAAARRDHEHPQPRADRKFVESTRTCRCARSATSTSRRGSRAAATAAPCRELRAMFNDAASAPAGRLVDRNPFANLRLPCASRGRRTCSRRAGRDRAAHRARRRADAAARSPPTSTSPSTRACGPASSTRSAGDRSTSRPRRSSSTEQWNAKSEGVHAPEARLRAARSRSLSRRGERLLGCRGSRVRVHDAARLALPPVVRSPPLEPRPLLRRPAATSISTLATRHFFGWYALNVLELADHVIAVQFGQRDGGELVRTTVRAPRRDDRPREGSRSVPAGAAGAGADAEGVMTFEPHPYTLLLPALTDAEYAALSPISPSTASSSQ